MYLTHHFVYPTMGTSGRAWQKEKLPKKNGIKETQCRINKGATGAANAGPFLRIFITVALFTCLYFTGIFKQNKLLLKGEAL